MSKRFLLLKVLFVAFMLSPLAALTAWAAAIRPMSTFWQVVALLSVVYSLVLLALVAVVQRFASNSFLTFVFPMRTTGGEKSWSTSRAHALAFAGKFDEATEEFEQLRLLNPDDGVLLREMAEFHLAQGNAERAAELLQHLRAGGQCTSADERYATQRLIDLYLGSLSREDRALVEMRRLADRFPDTPDGQGARAELRRRKLQTENAEQN